jgi:anamorsin
MAPSVTIDMSDDFALPTKPTTSIPTERTLLLSPPSLSSHQDKLSSILGMHHRDATDLQMLDRLSLGLVSLPESTYDSIVVLSDADGSRTESQKLLGRDVFALVVKALKTGGYLRSQDDKLGVVDGPEKNEAILAGLSYEIGNGFKKINFDTQAAVPLRLGARKNGVAKAAGGVNGPSSGSVSLPLNGKRDAQEISTSVPAGVGFDDGTGDSDDELIDEDELMNDEDLKRPITIRKYTMIVVGFY